LDGFQWFYNIGAAVGSIPTNDGDTCVFASLSPTRFEQGRKWGLEELYRAVLKDVSPLLAERVANSAASGKVRAFPGVRGFLRRAAGPGWALVGDAAYFKDPLTAHGITDALRDAEFLARAIVAGGEAELVRYQSIRDEQVQGLFEVTEKIASLEWDLDEAKAYHLVLSKEMNAEVELIKTLDAEFVADPVRTTAAVA
jgi:2-polyprenyl-6-methoxyphenol hydroxylase-like FAD-dependent oxidoreductase